MRPRTIAIVTASVCLAAACPGRAFARGKSCTEVSDVVGYEHCRRYGVGWSEEKAAPVSLELSLGAFFLDPRHRTMSGGFGKYAHGSFDYSGDLVGHSLAVGDLGIRMNVTFAPWAYAGWEIDVGGGSNSLPRTHAGGYDLAPTEGGLNSFGFGGGLFGGLRVPLGFVSLRLETLFGGRTILMGQEATNANGVPRSASVSLSQWTIEPRASFDIWVEPWLTLSPFGGVNALHYVDHFGGVAIGFHGKAYDGAFLW